MSYKGRQKQDAYNLSRRSVHLVRSCLRRSGWISRFIDIYNALYTSADAEQ
nr:MAG TPA: hypothetical protein [Caudoviricetes sp.]